MPLSETVVLCSLPTRPATLWSTHGRWAGSSSRTERTAVSHKERGGIFNNSLALHARSTLLAAELKLAAQRHKTRERTKEYMADSCFGCCRSLISAYILSLAITERVTH